jgi:hypothetical protein
MYPCRGDGFEYYTCLFQNMIATWQARWGATGPADFAWASTQLGDQGFGGVSAAWPSYVGTPRDAQQVIFPGRYPGVSRTARAGLGRQ